MDQRKEFVFAAMSGTADFSELCKQYGISRKTGYKWKERFLENGIDGLSDQPRRPEKCPSSIEEDIVCEIVKLKLANMSWGPKKIRSVYQRKHSGVETPSLSSFKRILTKSGLVKPRKRRPSTEMGRISNRVKATSPNQVWTVDFKGWWRTSDGQRFEPLTIRDAYSRYILCAQALGDSKTHSVKNAFESVFATYGVPQIIRSDNGSPFAAYQSPFGLTKLAAWWITLGIDLDRIDPGRPDQNGSHERMHRDIACEVQCDGQANQREQQAVLDTWRNTYNHERPHEALDMKVPADLYQKSNNEFKDDAEIEYPAGYMTRKVTSIGAISFEAVNFHLSAALAGWKVGLQREKPHTYGIWFCDLRLGHLDLESQVFQMTKAGAN